MTISNETFSAMAFLNKDKLNTPVAFREDSDLKRICDNISNEISVSVDSNTTEQDIYLDIVNQIDKSFYDKDSNYSDILFNMASGVSQEITDAFCYISGTLRDEVSSLSEKINHEMTISLSKMGAETLLNDNVAPDVSFGLIYWQNGNSQKNIDNVVERAIQATRMTNAGLRKNNLPNMALRSKEFIIKFKEVKLENSVHEMIIGTLNKIVPSEEYSNVTRGWDCICNKMSFAQITNNVYEFLNDIKNISLAIKIKDDIERISQVIKGVENLNLSPIDTETTTAINNNKQILNDLISVTEYGLLLTKETYKDTLILTPTLLNGEVYDEFKKQNGTLTDIAYYLRVRHNINNPLNEKVSPITKYGIPMSVVLESREQINNIIANDNVNIKMTAKVIRTKALRTAYSHVLTEYFNNIPDSLVPEHLTKNDFINRNRHLVNKSINAFDVTENNIEDSLYYFLIEMWHKNTFIEVVHSYLNTECKKMITLKEGDSLNRVDISKLNSKVVAILLTEYLSKKHLK
jgi:hypothetical protein